MAENGECLTPRRTKRAVKLSLKAKESRYTSNLKSAGIVGPLSSSDEALNASWENPDNANIPKHLHDDDTIKGQEIFSFQKRKHKDALLKRIQEAQKTPSEGISKIRRRIATDFSEDSGSEYEASSTDDSEESEVEEEQEKPEGKKEKLRFKEAKMKCHLIDSEEYFANTASTKAKTSSNTLDKLQTPRLPQCELQKLLSEIKISSEHKDCINKLEKKYQSQYNKWLYVLDQNFSILLYGLGSKKHILSNFQKEYLQDSLVVVVNGFFPTLNIKNILDSIIDDLLELDSNPSNIHQAADLIIEEITRNDIILYLLINNIEAIKNPKTQEVLSILANAKNIRLIATIDHINAPIIWDQSKLSKFNFTWWDVTTYSPYKYETECEMSSMTQQSNDLALSSLSNVFLSLTQNSQAIYLKVATYQIENSGPYYQGMLFKDLYMACRESFIVSSDLALRAQLNEFIDHKMIKIKRSADGAEYLIIPIDNSLLKKFMELSAN